MKAWNILGALLALGEGLGCGVAFAQAMPDPVGPDQRAEWTLYSGQGVDANLPGLPKQIVRREIQWEKSYFTGVGYAQPVRVPEWLTLPFGALGVSSLTGVVEFIGVQHRGLQTNAEANIAFVLRTGYGTLGPVRVRMGAGIGLSYAFGTPSYEDGPKNDPAKRYRFQNFNAIELDTGLVRFPDTSLVMRVHHRSGFYGLIAPRNVGSNFLTLAIRQRF